MKRGSLKWKPADDNLLPEEWAQIRQWLPMRSGSRCESCGGTLLGLDDREIEIQHRRARGMGGSALPDTHKLSNLLILHRPCHRAVEDRRDPIHLERGLWLRHEYHDDGSPRLAAEYPLVLWSGRRVLLDPDQPLYLPHPDEWGAHELAARLRAAEEGTA